MNKQDILKSCRIEGNIVKLPEVQLERKLYQEVAKSLNLIGGKWKGGKVMGFVFDEKPDKLLATIANGEKKDLKKEYQFFPTPPHLAEQLVELAEVSEYDLVIEPSAGQGAIIKAIQAKHGNEVYYCELMPLNRVFIEKLPNCKFITDNFLNVPKKQTFKGLFTKIIANPPFANNQDIDHINAMFDVCAEGGRIVSIASKHWQHSSNKKETEFRQWLEEMDAEIIEVAANEFKDSGTAIATVIIVIDKPASKEFNFFDN